MAAKNLLDAEGVRLLVERAQRLQPHDAAKWGRMTATEMLVHCNKIHAYLLSPSTNAKRKSTVKQHLIRWLVLYILPRYPRNATAPKEARTSGNVSSTDFDEEKKTFVYLLDKFSKTQNINHHHPYFGRLSTREWGIAMWKHTDHHLRQFGV